MKTDKLLYSFIGVTLLILAGLLSRSYAAEVNITVSPPPSIVIPSDPDLIQVPNTDIYYVPDVPDRIIFYNGVWYRQHEKHWFRASSPSETWVYEKNPPSVIVIPEYHGEHHIHWHDLKDKWREHEMREHGR